MDGRGANVMVTPSGGSPSPPPPLPQGSGEIDFREFVSCVWNYCTFDLKALVKFAFSLFDLDGSGVLEASEVRTLVEEVYGDGYKGNVRVQRIVEKIDSNADGEINFDEFNSFNRQYPALLFPAFSMQMTLRERIFGVSYWNKQTELRRMRGGGRTQSIFEILADMDEGEYKRKLDGLMADTAGGKWQPPSLEEQEKSGRKRRKKKKKDKKKGFSVSVGPESKETKGGGQGAKGEKAKAAAAAEGAMSLTAKRKPRRRRGGA